MAFQEEGPDIPPSIGEVVGGGPRLHRLATVSDRTTIEDPKALDARQRKLNHLQREGSRQEKGNTIRGKAKRRLSRCHAKGKNLREDPTHTATTDLVRTKLVIVVETLRPEKMLKSHGLARSLSETSSGECVRQLEYMCWWYGSRLVKADLYDPSTKRCSGCGPLREIPLGERTYRCASCGLVMDRDLNARRNLARVAAGSAETVNACGGPRFMPATAGTIQGIRNPPAEVSALTYA